MLFFSCSKASEMLLPCIFLAYLVASSFANFYQDAQITWGDQRAKILNGGQLLTLSLDQASGVGFQSKNEYLFGRFDMQLRLVPGNSAGSVTTFYVRNPYTVHTNVYAQGKGEKEQQFHLWFDPTTAFHTYSIVWNAQRITFLVDNIPLRVFHNSEAIGIPFPKNQPMRVYASLWNADDWATQGGRVKADWTKAPFVTSYWNFKINACQPSSGSSCGSKSTNSLNTEAWQTQELDGAGRNRLRWVQAKHMIYNYCSDVKRFTQGLPSECKRSRF
ncbi:hypothetical protein LguiA_022190 [Lonicera macranthoides]